MKKVMFSICLFWLAASSYGQTICPRHIETPSYPAMARVAHVETKNSLKVTVDTDGKVENVEVIDRSAHSPDSVLLKSAIENMRLWTFERPQSAPATQVIVYEYKFDSSLPVNDHQNPITKVNIDLPDRVTILANERVLDTSQSKKKRTKLRVL
jgi:TonB family protein